MASITMDTSEYEALQKNILLLEEAKKREKELNGQIKKLQDEKIEALENSANSVACINKTIETKSVFTVNSPKDTLDKLLPILRSRNNGAYHRLGDGELLDRIKEILFEVKTKEIVKDYSVTTRGFEEVRREMQDKYLSELSAETKKQLDRIEPLIKENKNLFDKNFELETENLELKDYKEKFEKADKDRLENAQRSLEANQKVGKVRKILALDWNMFNYNKFKKQLESAIEDKAIRNFIDNYSNADII